MSSLPEAAPPPTLAQEKAEKPPRAKREMTPEMLEKLRLAREKALATRKDRKLLKEREALVERETVEARWEALHEKEEQLKALQPKAPPPPPKKKAPPKKSSIVHLSPPLSEVEEEEESSEEEEEEETQNIPRNSRRALRQKLKLEEDPPQMQRAQSSPQPMDINQASREHQQLKIALKALGIRE
jgi:hypothetical protein